MKFTRHLLLTLAFFIMAWMTAQSSTHQTKSTSAIRQSSQLLSPRNVTDEDFDWYKPVAVILKPASKRDLHRKRRLPVISIDEILFVSSFSRLHRPSLLPPYWPFVQDHWALHRLTQIYQQSDRLRDLFNRYELPGHDEERNLLSLARMGLVAIPKVKEIHHQRNYGNHGKQNPEQNVRSRTADPYGFFSAGKKGKDKLPPPWLYELAGPPGPPGKDGVNGINGINGVDGKDGRDGIPGAVGPPGLIGPPGQNGMNGAPGAQGPPGIPGQQGVQGRDGSDGVNGKDGTPGTAGAAGPPGTPGQNAKDGRDGSAGPPGQPGTAGQNGKDGEDGKDGKDGAPGPPGSPGKDGQDGQTGTFGQDGQDGSVGAAGLSGVPGSSGVAGASGPAGVPGIPGTPGIQWPSSSVG